MAGAKIVSLVMQGGQRVAVSEARPPGRSFGQVFNVTFYQEAAALAAKISSVPTFRVMLVLPSHLSYTTWRRLDQQGLADELSIAQGSVSAALKELHALGFVERKGKGPVVEWRLNNDYGWRGSVEGFHIFNRQKAKEKANPSGPSGHKSHKHDYANSGRRPKLA